MPPAQKPAGAEGAERALPREQPVTADAATPTPANKGSASAAGAEIITMGNDDLLIPSLNPLRMWPKRLRNRHLAWGDFASKSSFERTIHAAHDQLSYA